MLMLIFFMLFETLGMLRVLFECSPECSYVTDSPRMFCRKSVMLRNKNCLRLYLHLFFLNTQASAVIFVFVYVNCSSF